MINSDGLKLRAEVMRIANEIVQLSAASKLAGVVILWGQFDNPRWQSFVGGDATVEAMQQVLDGASESLPRLAKRK